MTHRTQILVVAALLQFSCNSPVGIAICPGKGDILEELYTGGMLFFIATDGNLYLEENGGCAVYLRYFTPNFERDNYIHHGDSIYLVTPDGPFPIASNFQESFERYATFPDLFLRDINDTDRIWTAFTLQSPLAKSVTEYNALRKAILNGTETFRDNRIDLSPDPTGTPNRVLKFTAVAPSSDMITSKCSIESSLSHFGEGDDLWYQARYYFTDQFPYSIADFESEWMDQSPGPRIVFSGGALAIENKFGKKLEYRQSSPVPVPKSKWVTIKVHFMFHHTSGLVELWQDGVKIISASGPTLPLAMAIQTRTEVGISATSEGCVVFVDDIRLSKELF